MSKSLHLRSLLAVGVSATAILGAAPAFAQGQTTAPPNNTGPATVGEVIVTAQKREEAIQSVPIAVSAFSQDTLEKAKIEGGPNLVVAIPNVNFSKGNFTGYNFQIRGIGSKLISGNADAGTGIHLNNAPLTANNLFEAEFYDVERVEVLRGPQGTLYGRNATGGVVNVITAKPTDHFEAMVRGEVGNYNTRKARAMVNIPIIGDKVDLRLAGSYVQRDGFGKNVATGNDVDDRKLYGLRGTLAFNPTDNLRAYYMYDLFDEDDNRSRIGKQLCSKDMGPADIGGVAFSADPAAANVERGFFNQGCRATSLYAQDIFGTINSQGTLGGFYGALSGMITGDAYAGKVQDTNVRNIESYFDPIYQAHGEIHELNIEYNLADKLKFTSLTSFSRNRVFSKADYNRYQPTQTFNTTPSTQNVFAGPIGDFALSQFLADPQVCGPNYDPAGPCATAATPLFPAFFGGLTPAQYGQVAYTSIYQGLFPGGVVTDPQIGATNHFATIDISDGFTKQWTQELRVQSDFDGPLNFNIGGIWIRYKATGDYFVMFNTGTAFYQVNNFLNTGSANCAPTAAGCVFIDPSATPDRSGHNYYDSYAPYVLESKAMFGEFYYQMTDSLKWTLGLRYTDDDKKVEQHEVSLGKPGSGVMGPPATDPLPIKHVEFKETTGRFGFDWKPQLDFTNSTLLYAFYSRGYKAGGVNPPCSFQCTQYPSTYQPEFVNSMEIGTKNTLLDGSLVLNLTGFHYDYKGYQVSKIINRTSINENIDAKIKGLEVESIWAPIRALRFNTQIGYLDTEIGNSESIDTFNRTQGDPNLVLVKTASASNCVVPLLTAQTYLSIANATSPFFIPFGGGPFAEICNSPGASDGVPVNLKGKELPNSPHWTFSFGAQYTMDLTSDWTATLRGDYYKQTDSFARIYNSPADKIKGWQNVNATLTFDNDPMKLSVELYVKNATDEEAINDFYLTDDSSGLFRNAFYGDPRTYGLSVTKKF